MQFDMEQWLEKNFEVQRSGANLVFDCPFCGDSSRNYWFHPTKSPPREVRVRFQSLVGTGRCWRCDRAHNTFSFVRDYKHLDTFEAMRFISGDKDVSMRELLEGARGLSNAAVSMGELVAETQDTFSVPLPPGCTRQLPDELVSWFTDQRSFPAELLKYLGVRYCWRAHEDYKLAYLRGRAIFPIATGRTRAWQGYLYKPGVSRHTGRPFPKTRNPSGPVMRNVMFLYEHAAGARCVLMNEGIFDALRVFSRGHTPVGLMGKNLSYTQAYLLSVLGSEELCMCLDGGEKEEQQAVKNCLRLREFYDGLITFTRLPHGLDPDDVSEKTFKRCYRDRVSLDEYNLKYKLSALTL